METIKTLIVDDEAEARRGLRELLRKKPEVELLATCAGGAEAVGAIREHAPDLVFLDVQMPQVDGFEMLRRVEEEDPMPVIVFVTAYDQYALDAFKMHAVDYLLKPFTDRRLDEALAHAGKRVQIRSRHRLNQRLEALLEHFEEARAASQTPYLRRIAVKHVGRVQFLDVDEIDWIEAADNYVHLHTGERNPLVRATLSSLERQLDPGQFLRIHRSYMVRIDRVREVRPLSSGDALVVLKDGTELRSSRTYGEERQRLFSALPCPPAHDRCRLLRSISAGPAFSRGRAT